MRRYCLVVTAYLVRDGKTLLLKHKKLDLWLPPGGHVDEGETPDEAVMREVFEETGLNADFVEPPVPPVLSGGRVESLHQPQRVQVEEIPHHNHHLDLIYLMRAGRGEPRPQDGESDELRWCSPEDLEGPEFTHEIRESGRWAIRLVGESLTSEGKSC